MSAIFEQVVAPEDDVEAEEQHRVRVASQLLETVSRHVPGDALVRTLQQTERAQVTAASDAFSGSGGAGGASEGTAFWQPFTQCRAIEFTQCRPAIRCKTDIRRALWLVTDPLHEPSEALSWPTDRPDLCPPSLATPQRWSTSANRRTTLVDNHPA